MHGADRARFREHVHAPVERLDNPVRCRGASPPGKMRVRALLSFSHMRRRATAVPNQFEHRNIVLQGLGHGKPPPQCRNGDKPCRLPDRLHALGGGDRKRNHGVCPAPEHDAHLPAHAFHGQWFGQHTVGTRLEIGLRARVLTRLRNQHDLRAR